LAYPAASGDGPWSYCCKSSGCPCRRTRTPRPRRRCAFRMIRVLPRRPPGTANAGTGRRSRFGSGMPSSRPRFRPVTRHRRECAGCGSAACHPSASRRPLSAPRLFASDRRTHTSSSGSRGRRFWMGRARAIQVFPHSRPPGMRTPAHRTTCSRRTMGTRQDRSFRRTRPRVASRVLPYPMRRTRRSLLLQTSGLRPRISRRRASTRRHRRKSRHVRGAEPRA
jgi:hypothetical protein